MPHEKKKIHMQQLLSILDSHETYTSIQKLHTIS